MFQLLLNECRVQFFEMAAVVSDKGARMFCAEEQLFLVALPQHIGVSGGEYIKAAPGEYLSEKNGNVLFPKLLDIENEILEYWLT